MDNPDPLDRLSQESAQLSEQMKGIREKYKETINTYYRTLDKQGQLFPPGREDCQQNVSEDLRQYDRLVTECFRVGDTELLTTWGLDPIFSQSDGWNRLASPNLEFYIDSWKESIDKSQQHDFERICWILLRDRFQSELDRKKGLSLINPLLIILSILSFVVIFL
jgi:hypothetical protein